MTLLTFDVGSTMPSIAWIVSPPHAAPALRELVEGFARSRRHRVITYELIDQALTGDVVVRGCGRQSSGFTTCRRTRACHGAY